MGIFGSIKDVWNDVVVDSWNEACEEVNYPKLKRGSVLRIELKRLGIIGFDHYGIYAGKRMVIHFSEEKIRREHISKFIEGAGIFNGNHVDVMKFPDKNTESITLEDSYNRAVSCIGMKGYDVLESNCEHFALWCRTGVAFSGQALGKYSDKFEVCSTVSLSGCSINFPRAIGKIFNDLGMEKSRSISVSNIVDVKN
ncbi:lecithin retinol acyltransferase family protein [Photobacterium toruni]|uniref:NC domain protein n=1 Tax=Photobacterium toruni TaxID=1935446 RepID=A0A1T4UPW5_9GAMM|nr:lecithin retinol acyltransferase family protein [Photobacterium toruni]SKA54676.1 NC domain protein [Photobacterium toruni]SKA59385.1 NC domain protein [Photobacterium toruni]